jgi:hypothetical protein
VRAISKRSKAFNDKESAVEKGNLAPALRDALIKLGHQPAKRLTKFRGYDVLENDAILKVNPYNKGADWHWVAWDRGKDANPRSLEASSLCQALSPCRSFNYKKRSADVIGNAVRVCASRRGDAKESLRAIGAKSAPARMALKAFDGATLSGSATFRPRHCALPLIHRQSSYHRRRPPTRPAA